MTNLVLCLKGREPALQHDNLLVALVAERLFVVL